MRLQPAGLQPVRPDLENFPQPPKLSKLSVAHNGDIVTVTNVPDAGEMGRQPDLQSAAGQRAIRVTQKAAPAIQHGASCMAAAFQGIGFLMLLFGIVFFAFTFVSVFVYDTPFTINGRPANREDAAWVLIPFAVLWIGFCVLWLFLVRRFISSPDNLDRAWTLRLGATEWLGSRSYGGKVIGRCRPQDVERVTSGSRGRVMAHVAGKEIPLTGPMAGSESTWLVAAISQAIDSHRRAQLGRLPFIPKLDPDIVQGKRLRDRLPRRDRPWGTACLVLAITVFWNGIVGCFIAAEWKTVQRGWQETFTLLFLAPFALIGLALVGLSLVLLYQALMQARVPPTIVEVSELPLLAGHTASGFISQAGKGDVNRLSISLTCQEETTYTEGTSTRTEIRPIWSQELFTREKIRARADRPLEGTFDIMVPSDAMHSLDVGSNKIVWKLVVNVDAHGFVCIREFPVVVAPQLDEDTGRLGYADDG